MIYFDQAATSRPKPNEVKAAVLEAIEAPGNPSRGAHEASITCLNRVFESRMTLHKFFDGYDPRRVIFTSGATESLNLLLQGSLEKGEHVITTVTEHNSVLRPLYEMEKRGVELSFCGLKNHKVDIASIENLIKENTTCIMINHASNVTGFLVDLYKVKEICEKYKLLLYVDASQSAGEVPISMKEMGIDALAITGHKSLFGPQGIGALLLSERVNPKPLKLGGSGTGSHLKEMPDYYPTKLEAGTLNLPGIYGLKAGIDVIRNLGLDQVREKKRKLIKYLIKGIESIPGVFMYVDEQGVGILSFYIKGLDMALVCDELNHKYHICSRSGAHCAPLMHQALETGDEGLLRLSVSYFNTKEEADTVIKAIREIANTYIKGVKNGR